MYTALLFALVSYDVINGSCPSLINLLMLSRWPWLRDPRTIDHYYTPTYANFCVQICPIFAGPVIIIILNN